MNNQFDQNKILDDLKKQFPNPTLGASFLSYDNTKFYSLGDSKNTDYSSIDEVGLTHPRHEQSVDPRGHVYNRNKFMQPPYQPHTGNITQEQSTPTYPTTPTYPSQVSNRQFHNLPQSPSSMPLSTQNNQPRNIQPPPGFVNRNNSVSKNGPTYSHTTNYNSGSNSGQNTNYYQCPQCQQLAVSTCGCQFKDSVCPNGHKWYKLSNGNKQFGQSPNHQ